VKVYFIILSIVISEKSCTFAPESLLYHTMDISTAIKDRRKELKISQLDLSEMAGISLATVKDIERGVANPSLKTLESIGTVLGMEVLFVKKKAY